jgi:hypothetical protein
MARGAPKRIVGRTPERDKGCCPQVITAEDAVRLLGEEVVEDNEEDTDMTTRTKPAKPCAGSGGSAITPPRSAA